MIEAPTNGRTETTALFSANDAVSAVLPVAHIDVGLRNPRRRLDNIEELAESIRAYGLLQPIVVRRKRDLPDRFEVVAGHRRFAAICSLDWTEVPTIVRETDADGAYLLTVIENLQRKDLSPKEEAGALEVLLRERRWNTVQIAEAVKRSPAYISKRLRVFEDPVLGPLVLENRLTVSAAEELLPLKGAQRKALAEQAADESWEHADVRAALRRLKGLSDSGKRVSVSRQARELRRVLRERGAQGLTDGDRRELRLLFSDLLIVGKAKVGAAVVIPRLPDMRAVS
jgi:ParB family chromosome partitioning protein